MAPEPPCPAAPAPGGLSNAAKLALAFMLAVTVGIALIALDQRGRQRAPEPGIAPTSEPEAPAAAQDAPAPQPEPEPVPAAPEITTLAGAIADTRHLYADTFNEVSIGTGMLAKWCAEHVQTFKVELFALPETKRGLVLKDSSAEVGKRLCVRGQIAEIAAAKLPFGTIYEGAIVAGYTDVSKFVAVGDTGELVASSRARFCGVVTGRHSYSNAGGGTTHAVQLVGAFDLTAD